MSELYWLKGEQLERLRPFFPESLGKARFDYRRMLNGIIFTQRNGLKWKHATSAEDALQTLEAV